MAWRRGAVFAIAILVLAAIPLAFVPPTARAAGSIEVYLGGLNVPIALGFSPDGRIFYAERNTGNIRIIVSRAVLPTPFYTLTNTNSAGERGLLGLALHPDFPATPYVYAYQTYNDLANGTVHNRIVRITANADVGVSMQVLLKMPPLSGATNHNGGVIAFGPDGKLYAVVGENAIIALAQNLMSPMGKVLRMNDDGSIPSDNPYYGNLSVDNLIYSYGHRNMFGIAFHPVTGRAYVTENGPGCNDEINLLVAAGNFAWGTSQTCSSPPPAPQNTNQDGPLPRELPIWWWGPTICPTNAAIYGGPFFPAWRGDMFMGDCNNRNLHRLDLAPPTYETVASDTIVWTAPSFIMDVEAGPDGAIWFTTPTTIYRYYDTAQPPVASFGASPNPVLPGVAVTFDASASADPDGTIVSYSWDFGDSATGSGVVASHAYATPGLYTVTLTVVDNESLEDTATTQVRVDTAPIAAFTASPSPASPGQTVTFDGSGSLDDGTIVSYAWDFGDGNVGAGVVATHAYASSGTYTVTLNVTDDMAQTDEASQPLRVNAPPVASFTADPIQSFIGLPIQFASTSTDDGSIDLYVWDFGDVTTATGPTATHAYAQKGPFTVTLTITDDGGMTDSATRIILIGNRAPVITEADPAGTGASLAPDESRRFSVTAADPDGDTVTIRWRVNGVEVEPNAPYIDFSYARVGTYRVNATVSDGTLEASREWTVTVAAREPAIDWTVSAGLGSLAVVLGIALFLLWRERKRRAGPGP